MFCVFGVVLFNMKMSWFYVESIMQSLFAFLHALLAFLVLKRNW